VSGRAADSYGERVRVFSDIQRHLPRLRREARGAVLELGVRGGNSTAALLAGVEDRGGTVWSVDVDPVCAQVFAGHPQWRFACADSRDVDAVLAVGLPDQLDLLFIDTLHEYDQVTSELELWAPRVRAGGRILLHDAEVAPGVWRGVADYSRANQLPYRLVHGSNGLGVVYPGGGAGLRLLCTFIRPVASTGARVRRAVGAAGPLRRAVSLLRGAR
jgi:hypothetical protein